MKKVLIALAVLMVIAVGAAGGVYLHYQHAVDAFETTAFGDGQPHVVNLPKGSDATTVGKYLAREKIISDADAWHLWLWWRKLDPKLKAGEYEFVGPMTPAQAVDKIVRNDVMKHKFTIVEGSRCDEAMEAIGQSELGLDVAELQKLCTDKAFAHGLGLPGDRLEGYIFPDTPSFPKGVTEQQVVKALVLEAKAKLAETTRAPGITLSDPDVMTLASIIEKETGKCPEERATISCVLHNRLKKHMKLQTDPTVLYGMFVKTGKFDLSLVHHGWVAARTDENGYNTYVIPALPVGPIANPGKEAIQAALNPREHCDYLFYVAGPDGCSQFAATAEEHERNVQNRNGRIKAQASTP